MKRSQWITAAIVFLVTVSLYALTQNRIFGIHKKPAATASTNVATTTINVDTILHHAKEALKPAQLSRLQQLENQLQQTKEAQDQLHLYHQLVRFWADTARVFEPYAWYTAEAARLENSEKSLTFAAHLFLNNLTAEESSELKKWKALQAKDLFERSLKINADNDSAQVGLGAAYLYGGISGSPMEGIQKIRQVVERDSTNIYAQLMLGRASMVSGQLDRAIDRFKKVVNLQPHHLEAVLTLADAYERKGDNKEAITWYQKSLPLIEITELRKEVEKRINELSR